MKVGALDVNDIQKEAEFFLTRKAKEALLKKTMTQSIRYDNGETFLCTYFACKVPKSEQDDGIKIVASHINQLASKGLIHSALSHFVSYDLTPESTGYINQDGTPKELMTVVACYVLVPEATHAEILKDLKAKNEVRIET